MDLEMLLSLFAYNKWVNARLVSLVEQVSDERLKEQMDGSFNSIQGTVAHILQGELFYYYRWIGQEQPRDQRPSDAPNLGALVEMLKTQEGHIDSFLGTLTPNDLSATLRYGRRGGEQQYELPLWQVMLQMINHGTHHRAELSNMLTRVGLEPPPTDLIVYYEELAGPVSAEHG